MTTLDPRPPYSQDELDHLYPKTLKLQLVQIKWMPEKSKVQVDSHPRLSGIMDTVNSTLAHGPETRLPAAFYDNKGREIIETIGVEEWFSGFKESNEYREVGIGALAGDIVSRMVGSVERSGNDGLLEIGGEDGKLGAGRGGEKDIKFGMSGCHDTTLAALLSSLGCFDGEKWPPYTSHIAFELFRETEAVRESIDGENLDRPATARAAHKQNQSALSTLFRSGGKTKLSVEGIARKASNDLTSAEKNKLQGHYVRYERIMRKLSAGEEEFLVVNGFTCAYDHCPNQSVLLRGSFRFSLEPMDQADPRTNTVGYRHAHTITSTTATKKRPKLNRRGVGAKGEEWWCLGCLTELMREYRRLFGTPTGSRPPQWDALLYLRQYIVAEERVVPELPGAFTLYAPFQHGLYKWMAGHRYDSRKYHDCRGFFLGSDGESIYLDQRTRDLRGVLHSGQYAEISAAECRNVNLGEVIQRVSRIAGAALGQGGGAGGALRYTLF
ncbi:hypothetical protein P7C71_g3547, partial [Lecanoromycetidae sp. Uapishka_2]